MLGHGSYTFSAISNNIAVGNYSSIAEGCFFHDPDDNHLCKVDRKTVFTTNWFQPGGGSDIVIGNDVWIGQGVRILPSIKIGDGAIIGAGTVLAKDVPPFAVVVGNPQVIKRFRFTEEQIALLLEIKWWDWPKDKIMENKELMRDINRFLEAHA